MGDRWPPLHEFIGLAVGTLIIISLAVAVIVLAQSLGADGNLLIVITGASLLITGVVIARALT